MALAGPEPRSLYFAFVLTTASLGDFPPDVGARLSAQSTATITSDALMTA